MQSFKINLAAETVEIVLNIAVLGKSENYRIFKILKLEFSNGPNRK